MTYTPSIGETVTCVETGKAFVVAQTGCTFNYALSTDADKGDILSDEGVDIRQKRELLDRSQPFTAYVSSDGKHITGWKGNVLMTSTRSHTIRLTRMSYMHGKTIQSIVARDIHGGWWYGRGNAGLIVTMHPYKNYQALTNL